jgi:CIC family chloride channel protein
MRPADQLLTSEMTTREAFEKMRANALRAWPVSDERGLVGIVRRATLEKAAADGLSNAKLMDLMKDKEFPHLHLDQTLTVALERMGAAGLDVLPVVNRANVHKLEGIVALQDVLRLYGFAAQNTSG